MYGSACLLARILFPPPSLALVPYLTLSMSLAFPVLVRQQAAAAQHSLAHYLLMDAAPKTSKRRTQKLTVPEACSFYLGSLEALSDGIQLLSGWLHTLPKLNFPVASHNYWNHVWCFKTVFVTAGGQVYASHGGTLVSQWDASFRPGGGWIGLMEKQMCWHINSLGRAVRWLLDVCVSE